MGEVILTYVLILVQLWFVGKVLSPFTILPFSVILMSSLLRKEFIQTLGLSNFSLKGYRSLWQFLVVGIVVIFIIGGYVHSLQPKTDRPIFLQLIVLVPGIIVRFLAYIAPAFCQQVVLNSYFVNRIHFLLGKSTPTAIVIGILFSLVHFPNPVLSILTLVWGAISSHFFLKHRNVYPLVLVHAALAAVTYCVLPPSLHHEFRVGMQYSLYIPSPCDGCFPEFLN